MLEEALDAAEPLKETSLANLLTLASGTYFVLLTSGTVKIKLYCFKPLGVC